MEIFEASRSKSISIYERGLPVHDQQKEVVQLTKGTRPYALCHVPFGFRLNRKRKLAQTDAQLARAEWRILRPIYDLKYLNQGTLPRTSVVSENHIGRDKLATTMHLSMASA